MDDTLVREVHRTPPVSAARDLVGEKEEVGRRTYPKRLRDIKTSGHVAILSPLIQAN